MTQHISIRVPWHDNGWNGTICKRPSENISCLKLKNIYENKIDEEENKICGECLKKHTGIPCINEGGAFMFNSEIIRTSIHPYKERYEGGNWKFSKYKDFKDIQLHYPKYSLPSRPYSWTMKKNTQEKSEYYDFEYDEKVEPNINTSWIQTRDNQRNIFDTFYKNVIPNESLCIIYAKQIPYTDEPGRVIIGIGNILKLTDVQEYTSEEHPELNSLTWETMISHSIREDGNDGFIIPYKEVYEKTKNDANFDFNSIVVFAPEESFNEFSYAAEHVSYDSVIEVILKCIKTYKVISKILNKDYSNVIKWLEEKLQMVLKQRGMYPGLSPMLYALGIKRGAHPLGEEIIKKAKENKEDLWSYFDKVMKEPKKYLNDVFSKNIEEKDQNTWNNVLSVEEKELFKLLSRFSLSKEQADVIFNEEKRAKVMKEDFTQGDFSTEAIIENPYLLYEKTRLIKNKCISMKKVDFAMYLIPSLIPEYTLKTKSDMDGENDKRRVRALIISLLESEAQNGNTIVPIEKLMELLDNYNQDTTEIINIKANLNKNNLLSYNDFFKEEIISGKLLDNLDYYKLVRIQSFEDVIEKNISKRLNAKKLEIDNDWKKTVDDYIQKIEEEKGISNEFEDEESKRIEKEARDEKVEALEKMSKSRIFALTGGAGTGKTTVLSIFCNLEEIKENGVLLLAPTGKAAVRLRESMGENKKYFETNNVAQFLSKSGRFDYDNMRYALSEKMVEVPETVIIDEASMLTLEMFGALIQAISTAKRIIIVGDPNQLPPIGAGKPFVDLVDLLEEKNSNNKEKYPNNHKKLNINRRQKGKDNMLDVEFANIFVNEAKIRDGIISDIIHEKQDRIKFERWDSKEELEAKIFEVLVRELELNDENDIENFNKSLGAEINDKGYAIFNLGVGKNAENWQILSPVKNMPQGVRSINRIIHEKYKDFQINNEKEYGIRAKFKNFGPEKIVYGDKVINVINTKRNGKDHENNNNEKMYVANGEIGITGIRYGKEVENLYVEFSSQPGITYTYGNTNKSIKTKEKNDFNDETGSSLELAYALTVHKAQGSEFKTVILVLDKDSKMISREMLYTALTRQTEKVIILYNDEPYELLKFSKDDNSNIAQRLTDLFIKVKDTVPSVVKYNNKYFDANKIHKTLRGELVRSKSEVIIANTLYSYEKAGDLQYYYEKELILKGNIKKLPDFTIKTSLGDTWYWEHCGLMYDKKYKRDWEAKEQIYKENGIEEGKNLIVTKEYKNDGFDSKNIEDIIKKELI